MNAAEESKLSPIIETILTLKKNDELFVKIPVDRGGRFFKFEVSSNMSLSPIFTTNFLPNEIIFDY